MLGSVDINRVEMYRLDVRGPCQLISEASLRGSLSNLVSSSTKWFCSFFIHLVSRTQCFGNASVLWQHRRWLCTKHLSKITAGYRCEVICFQLPSLPCYKVSVQLIISALHPPVFKMHYHNAPESQRCIVIEFNQLRREKLLNFSCAFITCRNKHVSNFQYIFQQTWLCL